MSFTEQDMLEQQQTFAVMKEEMARITAQFEAMLQEVGLTSEQLRKASEEPMTPELQALMDEAEAEAHRAGQARAAQFERHTGKSTPAPGRGRAGIIRM